MVIRKIIKPPLMALLKRLDLYSLFMLRKAGPLQEDGWFRSFREKAPVDAQGDPLPWITYPAIVFLTPRVNGGMCVFEYGCGASTLWWAARVKEVVSVEHDRSWYEKVVSGAPGNVTVTHVPLDYGGAYAGKIAEHVKRFDIVVLDGRDRVNCARNSLASLKDGGIIIWDNSDREEYEEGFRFLFDHGFRKIEFVGFAPGIVDRMETGIFYRPGNCLGI
jgi:hypothetical protein